MGRDSYPCLLIMFPHALQSWRALLFHSRCFECTIYVFFSLALIYYIKCWSEYNWLAHVSRTEFLRKDGSGVEISQESKNHLQGHRQHYTCHKLLCIRFRPVFVTPEDRARWVAAEAWASLSCQPGVAAQDRGGSSMRSPEVWSSFTVGALSPSRMGRKSKAGVYVQG